MRIITTLFILFILALIIGATGNTITSGIADPVAKLSIQITFGLSCGPALAFVVIFRHLI